MFLKLPCPELDTYTSVTISTEQWKSFPHITKSISDLSREKNRKDEREIICQTCSVPCPKLINEVSPFFSHEEKQGAQRRKISFYLQETSEERNKYLPQHFSVFLSSLPFRLNQYFRNNQVWRHHPPERSAVYQNYLLSPL